MTTRLAILAGSFNPPGTHHREVVARLAERFDEVVVVPHGPRADEPAATDIAPTFRAAMVDVTFRRLARVRVDLFDMESATFTPPGALIERLGTGRDTWLVVGPELLKGGREGASRIHKEWVDGDRLWRQARFAVVAHADNAVDTADLPPHGDLFPIGDLESSTALRSRIFHHQPVDGLLLPEVADYIARHGLYRGAPPTRRSLLRVAGNRLLIVADGRNKASLRIAERFGPSHDDPELIVVIGGDGTMLRAIREHWRRRVPFYGINAGHIGFLLNDTPAVNLANEEFVLEHVPLLHVETEAVTGEHRAALAFNDAWVERATGQAAWIEVNVNGQTRLPRLVADGALIATAAGSTSYARAMGATPLPLGTEALLLVGSNVLVPDVWRPVVLPLDSVIELRTLEAGKRPLQAYVDGISHGEVRWLRARMSNIAAAELAFSPGHDPLAKLGKIQFPAR